MPAQHGDLLVVWKHDRSGYTLGVFWHGRIEVYSEEKHGKVGLSADHRRESVRGMGHA